MNIKIVFFGSTRDSIIVLNAIQQYNNSTIQQLTISAVVTQPPRSVGRKRILTPTPVQAWAKERSIPVLSFPPQEGKPWLFADEEKVIDALQPVKADLLISASFGQKIPWKTIKAARFGGLNIHPSLLPRWRGADPVPWAILTGDRQTGVTVVTLSEQFDQGQIIAQKKVPITDKDFSEPLRTRLFEIGADLLVATLSTYLLSPHRHDDKLIRSVKYVVGKKELLYPYAKRFRREDGFIPWELVKAAQEGQLIKASTIEQYNNVTIVKALKELGSEPLGGKPLCNIIERSLRALSPWPGVWTRVNIKYQTFVPSSGRGIPNIKYEEKRLKILKAHVKDGKVVIDEVQLEGKKPVTFTQFAAVYLR